jgi:outer membrane protein TolC
LQGIREQNRKDFLSLRDEFQRRVEAGQGSAVDLALLDAEIANQAAEAEALRGQSLARSAALGYRIGRKSGGVIKVERPSGLPLPASSSSLEKFAIERTPLRLALIKRKEAALARLAIVRADRYENIEAGLIAEHDTDRGGILLGIGFNMDLPFWNKNEAAVAGAQANVEAARNDLRTQEPGRVAALVKLRHRSAQAAERSAAKFSREVVPLFETALTQTKEAIEKGQMGSVAIQPVITRLTESRLRSFELTVAAFEARAELEAALGGRLEEALGASVKN